MAVAVNAVFVTDPNLGAGRPIAARRDPPCTLRAVELTLAIAAASIATLFAVELIVSWRRRPRLHAEIWAAAFAAYAVATWALAHGLAFGWTSISFRVFYYLGAIANISLLAAGSVALASERIGRIASRFIALWLVFGFFSVFLADIGGAFPVDGVPEGSDLFGFTFTIEALTLPGPRMFAAISGALGSVVVIGLAAVTVVRAWKPNRRRAHGNILIIGGTVAPALGGSLTALGESAGLALSLAVGITLLWFGYRMASTVRTA